MNVCYICKKKIAGERKKDVVGFSHLNCFLAKSKMLLRPFDVEEFDKSSSLSSSGSIKDILDKNTIGKV